MFHRLTSDASFVPLLESQIWANTLFVPWLISSQQTRCWLHFYPSYVQQTSDYLCNLLPRLVLYPWRQRKIVTFILLTSWSLQEVVINCEYLSWYSRFTKFTNEQICSEILNNMKQHETYMKQTPHKKTKISLKLVFFFFFNNKFLTWNVLKQSRN